jgi:putative transposase
MTNYRRNFVPGGSYFFTVNLSDRTKATLVENIELLRRSVRDVRDRHPFTIQAMVVLPDHLHAIWSLPSGDQDFSMRWRLIKTQFSLSLPQREAVSPSRAAKGERGIWQRRYWEHTLRDEDDFERHVHYIHFNPVKHGHAPAVGAWPYSSFHRMVREGAYANDWDGRDLVGGVSFGER